MNSKTMLVTVTLLSLSLSTAIEAVPSPKSIDAKIGTTLEEMASRSRLARYFQTGVGFVGAGVFAGFGIHYSSENSTLGPTMIALSGLYTGLGIASLVIDSHPEGFFKNWQKMPAKTSSQLTLRIGRGEGYLETLALQGYRARIMGGVTSAAAGVGLLIASPFANDAFTSNSTSLAFIVSGAVLVALSPFSFFIESDQEKIWKKYQDWKRSKGDAVLYRKKPLIARIRPSLGVVPTSDGAVGMGQVTLSF